MDSSCSDKDLVFTLIPKKKKEEVLGTTLSNKVETERKSSPLHRRVQSVPWLVSDVFLRCQRFEEFKSLFVLFFSELQIMSLSVIVADAVETDAASFLPDHRDWLMCQFTV